MARVRALCPLRVPGARLGGDPIVRLGPPLPVLLGPGLGSVAAAGLVSDGRLDQLGLLRAQLVADDRMAEDGVQPVGQRELVAVAGSRPPRAVDLRLAHRPPAMST